MAFNSSSVSSVLGMMGGKPLTTREAGSWISCARKASSTLADDPSANCWVEP